MTLRATGSVKATIMQLGAAASVEWTMMTRLDDGRDPFFAHYRADGRYPLVDGTWRPIGDERDIDLRDGSPQIVGKSSNEVASLRAIIVRKTVTAAKLRALRSAFGIEHQMSPRISSSRSYLLGPSSPGGARILRSAACLLLELCRSS